MAGPMMMGPNTAVESEPQLELCKGRKVERFYLFCIKLDQHKLFIIEKGANFILDTWPGGRYFLYIYNLKKKSKY